MFIDISLLKNIDFTNKDNLLFLSVFVVLAIIFFWIFVVIIKKIIAVLKCPKSHPKFIIYAKAIFDAMKNNTLFSGSAATLAIYTDAGRA